MLSERRSMRRGLLPLLAVILAGCSAASPSPTALVTAPATAAQTQAASTAAPSASIPAASIPAASIPIADGGMKLRFVNLTDGGSVAATPDKSGRPLVAVKIEVTGAAPMLVDLSANGFPAMDAGGHSLEATNTGGVVPFVAEIAWSPMYGGGEYTLVAAAMDKNKNFATATVHVTVTGTPSITVPPAPTLAQATASVTRLISDAYKVTIPKPSLQRFDFPSNPFRNRWIGAAYYKGMRYYVSIFDDGHVEWANGPYADPAHRSTTGMYTYCRPAGNVRVLVVFVDYGNTGTTREAALAAVPVTVTWLNGLYTKFAVSQGFSSSPMHVEADAAWVASPPSAGDLLTAQQITTLTGKNPSAYSFVMEIDLDANASFVAKYAKGSMEPGGGFALEACGTGKFGAINIWSSLPRAPELMGGLEMDFNHELSHMFGMMDDWPYLQGVAGPDGLGTTDWIPYTMFGWTDTDGDGIPEVIDPTPYGTTGPQP